MRGEASVLAGAPVVVFLVFGPRLGPQLWGAQRVGGGAKCRVAELWVLLRLRDDGPAQFGPQLVQEIRVCVLRTRSWERGSAVCVRQACAGAALPWRV